MEGVTIYEVVPQDTIFDLMDSLKGVKLPPKGTAAYKTILGRLAESNPRKNFSE